MAMQPPNETLRGAVGHSGQPSVGPSYTEGRIAGSNEGNRFGTTDAKMPQPPSVIAPGQGAVPVQPFSTSGFPNRIDASIPDMAGLAKPGFR